MKKNIYLLAIVALLAACSNNKGHYQGAPAVPTDAPPPTNLMTPQ